MQVFSHQVVSDSLWPHGLWHTRPSCPSPSPWVCPSSFSLNWWCHPTILFPVTLFFCLQSFPVSGSFPMRVFRIRWSKYWSFSFRISPSKEYSGLIPFRIDWFHLLAIQGALKSLLQHHNSKTSILQHSAFIMVQLSHLYVTTGETIFLTIQTFVGKVMSLLFNMLSRFVVALLPRSKHLFTSCLQSLSAAVWELKKIKSVTASTFSPSICHEELGPIAVNWLDRIPWS